MLYAVISDVHANLEALSAVLKDIKKRPASGPGKVKQVLFLGDAVGYGPNPNEATSMLREKCSVLLAGNHDRASIGLAGIERFNPSAKAAIRWTASVLTDESRKIIREFSVVKVLGKDSILLVHSTPWEPEEWHYFLPEDADLGFRSFDQRICFLGHSHNPFILEKPPSGRILTHWETATLNRGSRYIINAGSVGQPRDRDPRACYALIDDEKVEIIRVEYPIKKTQRKMQEAGLPRPLIERLSQGV